MQAEQWWLIEDQAESNAVCEAFEGLLSFNPYYDKSTTCQFDFTKINEPFIVFDISGISISDFEAHDENGNYRATDCIRVLKSIFVDCMGEDGFMYSINWQHDVFKYNPRIDTIYDYYMTYMALPNTRAYYPDFHSNGDYVFFVAKDLSWGYLTHPFLNKIWVYGSQLVGLIEKQMERLGFLYTDSS